MAFLFSLSIPVTAVIVFKLVEWWRNRPDNPPSTGESRIVAVSEVAARYFVQKCGEADDEPMGEEEKMSMCRTQQNFAESAIKLYIKVSRGQ